ncbi:MAG: hypothetical protein B6I29_04830 [Marinitoga sp. 4572_148]|nr:MAG: hypothetical protein B6I29_04830 [Marinitoga sp. 4572_148]
MSEDEKKEKKEQNEQEELDLNGLLDNAEEINKLMDLGEIENPRKTDTNELEEMKIDDTVYDLKDIEIPDETLEEGSVPEVEDVEKMVAELEEKFSPKPDEKKEVISDETPEDTKDEESEKEMSEEEQEVIEEEIPELEIDETPEDTKDEESEKEMPEKEQEVIEKEIPELEIDETPKDTKEETQGKNLEMNMEEEIILPNINITENFLEDRFSLFEEKINNKFEKYEKEIEELKVLNNTLKKRLRLYDSIFENMEQTIILMLKNMLLSAFGETNALINMIMEVKQHINSKKNLLDLVSVVESLKVKFPEQDEYVLNYILGNLYFESGDWSEAEKSYLRALHFCEKDKSLDMQFNTSVIQNNLGTMYAEKKKWDLARNYFESALEIRKNLEEKTDEKYSIYLYYSLNNLGSLEMNSGNLDKADEYFNEAYKMLQNGNMPKEDQAMLLFNMGNLYAEKVQEEQAKEFLEKAFEIYKDLYEKDPLKYSKKLNKTLDLLANYDETILQEYKNLSDELKIWSD